MSDLILQQLQGIRAENALRHEEILTKLDGLTHRVSCLEDRVSSVEILVVRQQRDLYSVIDRLEHS